MSGLTVRPAEECRYDLVALGEIMLRLDPGEGRIRTARQFQVWEGGGEYNVAVGCGDASAAHRWRPLRRKRVGRLLEDSSCRAVWIRASSGGCRLTASGGRCATGLTSRSADSASAAPSGFRPRQHGRLAARAGDFDWDHIFGKLGVRWFHTGGIFAALSETTPELVIEAVARARHGTVVSYDLNYRPSLWKAIGGAAQAQEVNRRIAENVDVMIGNEEDFTACLGLEVEGVDEHLSEIIRRFQKMIERAAKEFPNFKVTATTLRAVRNATRNDWWRDCWARETEFAEATPRGPRDPRSRRWRRQLRVRPRFTGCPVRRSGRAVEYGAAHGALAMTTPGDTSMATLAEVEELVRGASARIRR